MYKLVLVSVNHSRGICQAFVMARVERSGKVVVSKKVYLKILERANIGVGDCYTN